MYTTLWSRHKYVKFAGYHVGIQGNEQADKSAKAAMNDLPSIMTIPFSDYEPYIHTYIRKKWLDFLDNQLENKFHSVQPTLGCWPLSSRRNRRVELVLSRIRIGHSYLTQRHLLVGENPPECVSCQERRTVSHTLVHCAAYIHIRDCYFHVDNLKDVFDLVDPANIMGQFHKWVYTLV